MQRVTINTTTVDLEVIPEGDAATALELDTVARLDAALRAYPAFQAQYPDARLERVDSMRALRDDEAGRYYLRYASRSGMTEFWGHTAAHGALSMSHGIVAVSPVPASPATGASVGNVRQVADTEAASSPTVSPATEPPKP